MGFSAGINADAIEIEGDTNATLVPREQAARQARQGQADQADEGTDNPTAVPARPDTEGDRQAQAATGGTPASDNLDRLGTPLAPRLETAYADAFDNYHIAMQLASRPACTLEEFIRFWHGGATINQLLGDHIVEGPTNDLAYATVRTRDLTQYNPDGTEVRGTVPRVTATYYKRIFKTRIGPGDPPTQDQRGYTTGPDVQPTSVNAGVDKAYPETRANWDELLLAYRDRVRRILSPST